MVTNHIIVADIDLVLKKKNAEIYDNCFVINIEENVYFWFIFNVIDSKPKTKQFLVELCPNKADSKWYKFYA